MFVLGLLIAGFLALSPRGDSAVYEGSSLRNWALKAQAGDPHAMEVLRSLGSNAVPGLVDLLGRQDSFLRAPAMALWGKLPRRLARPLLGWAAGNQNSTYRCAAAKALGTIGPPASSAVPALAKALRDREGQVCSEAAWALGRMGAAAVPQLMRAVADTNGMVRSYAAYALGQVGTDAEPALPLLIDMLADTNQFARDSARYSAAIIGNPSMLAISNVLDHGDAPAREAAVRQLVNFRRSLQIPVPALAKMAQAPEPGSRSLALAGLAALRLADNTTLNAVTNALKDSSAEVRLAAVKALKAMIWRAHEALPQLIERLHDESPEVRHWTVLTLADLGPRAEPAATELGRLAREEPGLNAIATQALSRIRQMSATEQK